MAPSSDHLTFLLSIAPHLRTKHQHHQIKMLRGDIAPDDAMQLVFYNSGDAILEDYYLNDHMWDKNVDDYDVSFYENVSERKIPTNEPLYFFGNGNA